MVGVWCNKLMGGGCLRFVCGIECFSASQDGDTALHLACRNGFENIVSLLKSRQYKAKLDVLNHVSYLFSVHGSKSSL